MANDTAVPLNRIERILAFMIASSAGLSILAIVSVIVANLAGVETREGLWVTVAVLPFVGLTLALALIIAFVVARLVRTRRTAGDGR